jgi:hypothetical protein
LDRDPRRSVAEDFDAYVYRVLHTLYTAPHYTPLEISVADALENRWRRVVELVPKRVWTHCRFRWGPSAIPQYALIEKGKCFRLPDGCSVPGFVCKKTHAHSRELCSYGSDPC